MTSLTVIESGLIPIVQDESGEQLVDARALHEFLCVGKQFSHWIKARIEKYEFVENVDFITISQKRLLVNGGYKLVNEHLLTMDTEKELAMVESHNAKGREGRRRSVQEADRRRNPRRNWALTSKRKSAL